MATATCQNDQRLLVALRDETRLPHDTGLCGHHVADMGFVITFKDAMSAEECARIVANALKRAATGANSHAERKLTEDDVPGTTPITKGRAPTDTEIDAAGRRFAITDTELDLRIKRSLAGIVGAAYFGAVIALIVFATWAIRFILIWW